MAGDRDVRWDLPAPIAFVLDAEHQHSQAVEGETPNHAKGIRLAQQVDIPAAYQDGKNLEHYDQVHDPVGGAEARMRLPEPVGENTILRNAVEGATGRDDHGSDGAG